MIKNPKELVEYLVNYLRQQLILNKKNGVAIHFDGSLGSLINLLIASNLEDQFKVVLVTPIFNQNKYYAGYIQHLANKLKTSTSFVDLSKDLETIGFHNQRDQSTTMQVNYRKRFVDLAILVRCDQESLGYLSNLTYSQWIVGFPSLTYQSHEQIHLLFRFFYSELQELGKFLGLDETVLEREPSSYLWEGQLDRDLLKFSYQELEKFLRSQMLIKGEIDNIIAKKLLADNRNKFNGPLIQRPSNFLG